MRNQDPTRIPPILEQLQKLWLANPTLNFGQLVTSVDGNLAGITKACLFYADDKDVLASIADLIINCEKRQKAKAEYDKELLRVLTDIP